MAYNNREHGGRFPENEEIFTALDKVAAPLAESERMEPESGAGIDSPSCNWSSEKK
ncbi:MAG: hypothetical protein OEV42_02940 [Deltaproteobacteria bacterium]|nr:hypothetical protein [Deltaproteobacteria bacterium]